MVVPALASPSPNCWRLWGQLGHTFGDGKNEDEGALLYIYKRDPQYLYIYGLYKATFFIICVFFNKKQKTPSSYRVYLDGKIVGAKKISQLSSFKKHDCVASTTFHLPRHSGNPELNSTSVLGLKLACFSFVFEAFLRVRSTWGAIRSVFHLRRCRSEDE